MFNRKTEQELKERIAKIERATGSEKWNEARIIYWNSLCATYAEPPLNFYSEISALEEDLAKIKEYLGITPQVTPEVPATKKYVKKEEGTRTITPYASYASTITQGSTIEVQKLSKKAIKEAKEKARKEKNRKYQRAWYKRSQAKKLAAKEDLFPKLTTV